MSTIREALYQCLENTINLSAASDSSVALFRINTTGTTTIIPEEFCNDIFISITANNLVSLVKVSFSNGDVRTGDGTKIVPYYKLYQANIQSNITSLKIFFKDSSNVRTYYLNITSTTAVAKTVTVKKDLKYGHYYDLLSVSENHGLQATDISNNLIIELKQDTLDISNGHYVEAGEVTYAQTIKAKDYSTTEKDRSSTIQDFKQISAYDFVATNNITAGNTITTKDLSASGTISATGKITGFNSALISGNITTDSLNITHNSENILSASSSGISTTKDITATGKTITAATFVGALTGNASTATTLQTSRTLTIGNSDKTFNGSENVSWTLAEIGAAPAHSHPYAGSATDGGAANSVKTSITFNNSGNGSSSGSTFNGSSAITISYNSIGAASSGHTHYYAASDTVGGSANSAKKLTNTTAVGSTLNPVYFTTSGLPAACTYSLNKTVPSDAQFTDTTYSAGSGLSLSGTTFRADVTSVNGRTGATTTVRAYYGSYSSNLSSNTTETKVIRFGYNDGTLSIWTS